MLTAFGQEGTNKVLSKFLGKTEDGPTNIKDYKMTLQDKNYLFKLILVKFVTKMYKYPDQAFATFDFGGNGFVSAQNVYNHKIVYRLPFTRVELKNYLENHSAFKNKPKMPIQIFTKVFYPNMSELENNKKRKNSKGSDGSSEDENFDDTYSKRV